MFRWIYISYMSFLNAKDRQSQGTGELPGLGEFGMMDFLATLKDEGNTGSEDNMGIDDVREEES